MPVKENRFESFKLCGQELRTREVAFFVFIADFLLFMVVAIELGASPVHFHMIAQYIVWLLFFYTVIYRPYDAMVVMLLGIECVQFLASVLLSVVTIIDGLVTTSTTPFATLPQSLVYVLYSIPRPLFIWFYLYYLEYVFDLKEEPELETSVLYRTHRNLPQGNVYPPPPSYSAINMALDEDASHVSSALSANTANVK
ncbi:hypothetical protein QR680_007982 [Steinernema hermaphroditum]|uniref:Uncharacterized protein n=1 Tax=Steinernema hermaphroditum TaxID=289476 RepID=A0AA39M673_9BILA|nr:hypothetical protein QR680_007982 [Steinernema hermaphroditum]